MALTIPVRDKKILKKLAGYFLKRREYRNHLLLLVGIYTALRISDILRIQWTDVYDSRCGAYRSHITLTEQKTGKATSVALHPKIIEALRLYYPFKRGVFVFSNNRSSPAAISRVQAWRILHNAGEAVEPKIRVSAHALRKTFGYWAWKGGAHPIILMDIFNHSSYAVTRRYLGLTQDDRDQVYLNMTLC